MTQFLDVAVRHPGFNAEASISAEEFEERGLAAMINPVALNWEDGASELDHENDVNKPFAESLAASELVNNLMREAGFVILDVVENGDHASRFNYEIRHSLDIFLQAERYLFSHPTFVEVEDAYMLTNNGRCTLLQFGTYCPVCLDRGEIMDCTSIAFTENQDPDYPEKCTPVIWYNTCIYTCSAEHREELVRDTIKYTCVPPPLSPVASTCCVVGPPLSGRTDVAEQLSNKLGLVYLDVPSVLAQVIASGTTLALRIKDSFETGTPLDEETIVLAIKAVTSSDACVRKGWVLDGFPENSSQAEIMEQNQIIPHHVFLLNYKDHHQAYETVTRRMNDSISEQIQFGFDSIVSQECVVREAEGGFFELLYPDGLDAMLVTNQDDLVRLKRWKMEEISLQTYYQCLYDNCCVLDAGLSRWALYDTTERVVRQSRLARQEYRLATVAGRPARVHQMNVTAGSLHNNRSDFGRYCPVCWIEHERLRSFDAHTRFSVAYRSQFFRMCNDEHRDKFIEDPDKYAPGTVPKAIRPIPEQLPYRIPYLETQRIRASNCVLKGYCPVTLKKYEAKGHYKLVAGSPACCVLYKADIYRLANERALSIFMETPGFYYDTKLPRKMPPVVSQAGPVNFAKMGKLLAYMEASSSSVLTLALASINTRRIKYPSEKMDLSVLIYLSLFLKANNPNSPRYICDKYNQQLELFLKDCAVLPELAKLYRSRAPPQTNSLKQQALGQEYDQIRQMRAKASFMEYFQRFMS
jgi:adenylate kinase family enzyme